MARSQRSQPHLGDDYLVTLARSARVDVLVSGDADLVDLEDPRRPVRTPRELIELLDRFEGPRGRTSFSRAWGAVESAPEALHATLRVEDSLFWPQVISDQLRPGEEVRLQLTPCELAIQVRGGPGARGLGRTRSSRPLPTSAMSVTPTGC